MVVPSSTLNDELADVNLTLNNFDEILHAISNADALLPDALHVLPDITNGSPVSDRSTSDSSDRSSNKDEATDQQQIRLAREARRRRLYRENQKLGRDGLRRQVVELGEELARIKQAQADEKARLEVSRSPAYYLWKSLALRQRQERQVAEAEQRQLKAAVKTQATYLDMLGSIASKRLRMDHEAPSSRTKTKCLKVDEPAFFNSCIRELQANYTRAEEVLKTCSFDDVETDTVVQSEQRRESDGKLEYLQRLTKEVQPYSLYETGSSLWDVSDRYHAAKADFKRYEQVKDPESTYAVAFSDVFYLNSGEVVKVRQRLVFCRFFEEERIVFTWKHVSEGQGIFSGMHQDETGWAWLYPSTETTEPGTVVAKCTRRAPMYCTPSISEATRCGFDEMLQENGREAWAKMVSSLDKLMLDCALASVEF